MIEPSIVPLSTTAATRALYVGIDVGKSTCVAGVTSTPLLAQRRFDACPVFSFPQSRTGYSQLVTRLRTYGPLDQVAVLLEKTGHYHRPLVQFLQEQHIAVYTMHVQERPSRVKNDKRDALGLANTLYNQVEKQVQLPDTRAMVHRVIAPDETAQRLQGLMRYRYERIQQTTRLKNKLIAINDELFPEFTQVLADPNGATALLIRASYPTAASVAQAPHADLCALRLTRARRPSNDDFTRLQALARQSIGVTDSSRVSALTLEQTHLIAELRLLQAQLTALDEQLTDIVAASRAGQILTSFPVIGPIQAATIIAAIGTIANFPDAAHLKAFCGWSPTQTQTGTSVDRMTLTRAGVRPVKQAIYLIALLAIRYDTEWRDRYQRLVPLKCAYDARTKSYKGRMKVVGRICGDIIQVIYALLNQDHDTLLSARPGEELPPPVLYDRAMHHAHSNRTRGREHREQERANRDVV